MVLKGIDGIEIRQSLIDSKELFGVFAGDLIRLRQHASNLAINDDSYNYINKC